MNEALAIATAEESRDPVPNAGLRDKVVREKLSLDHVWLINYDSLKRQAVSTGKPFEGPRDPLEACRAWIATCDRFNVKAYNETTTEETFKTYQRKMLEKYAEK